MANLLKIKLIFEQATFKTYIYVLFLFIANIFPLIIKGLFSYINVLNTILNGICITFYVFFMRNFCYSVIL